MKLYINTTTDDLIELTLRRGNKMLLKKEISARRAQAEKLLPAIEEALKEASKVITDISAIAVFNRGGTFSSLRIGVVTANALGYALGVPVESAATDGKTGKTGKKRKFSVVKPEYDREPNITCPRNA